MVVVPENPDKD